VSRVNNSGAGTNGRGKASSGKRKVGKAKAVRAGAKAPPQRKVIRIVDLDPFDKCGRGTSVQRLIRVDELIDQEREAHLVFFDRHGWYCEHGRTCPAVGHARKHAERGVRSH
jgi:hypothetical protein